MGKYLKLHEKFSRKGLTLEDKYGNTAGGLCSQDELSGDTLFQLIRAGAEGERNDGGQKLEGYWGYGGRTQYLFAGCDYHKIKTEYTPLRQNIVLLMAAINEEL